MSEVTVALLHPGEMGSAIGACLVEAGHRTRWVAAGRGPESRRRAAEAGLTECADLAAALAGADAVLSVCPPHAARDVARAVAAHGFAGLYCDANAVAPATAREIAGIVAGAGARFVDGGIIGPPPTVPGRCRLYLSGDGADGVAALFAGTRLDARPIEGGLGAASALKMCYAGWNKGAIALMDAILALAAAEAVIGPLQAEFQLSSPEAADRQVQAAASARKAWRWSGEMHEIADTMAAAGLPGGFHRAAADICDRLAGFKDKPATIEAVVAELVRTAGR